MSDRERVVLGRGIDLTRTFTQGWLRYLDGEDLEGEHRTAVETVFYAHRMWVVSESDREGHMDKYLGAVSNVLNRLSMPNADLATHLLNPKEVSRAKQFFSFIYNPPKVI